MPAPAQLQSSLYRGGTRLGTSNLSQSLPTASRRAQKFKPPPEFDPKLLSYHWDTKPPLPVQLLEAEKFFQRFPATFLSSADKFKRMAFGENDSAEVCFLGRSNVGKSSLLNAVLCAPLAHASARPGRTKLMNSFGVGNPHERSQRLIILDMPGYGQGGRAEWGQQIMKYLEKRRQLKRAFLLVDAEHGMKPSDKQILELFKNLEVPYQVVLSKADKILFPKGKNPPQEYVDHLLGQLSVSMQKVQDAIGMNTEESGFSVGEIISCSAEKWANGHRLGINELRFAILRATGMEYQPPVRAPKIAEYVTHEELFGKIPHFP